MPGWQTVQVARGANGTWNPSATSGAWQTAADWLSGIIPGSTTITTDTDIATFNSNSTTLQITPDANRDIGGITFDTAAGAYTIGTTGGNALLLTTGGTIQIASTFSGSNIAETVNAPLTLEGNYTFADNSTNTGVSLNFGGAIRSGTSGLQTLNVSGSGAMNISGAIGSGTGVIGFTKNGTGTLTFSGSAANTYTGLTQVNSGTLILSKPSVTAAVPGNLIIAPTSGGTGAIVQLAVDNQIGDSATVTINPTGQLVIPNGTQDYITTLSLNGGSVSTGTGSGCFLGFLSNSGQIQTTGNATTSTINGVLNLNADSSHTTTFTVAPDAANGIDLDIPGIVVAGGGIVKTGFGNMRLSGANNFTGLTVQQGDVTVNTVNNAGTNGPLGAGSTITLGSNGNQGYIVYTGASGTTNMAVSLPTGGVGEFIINNSATVLGLSGVISGGGILNKESPGAVDLSNANSTYSGGTFLSQGTLMIGASSVIDTNNLLHLPNIDSGPIGTGALSLSGGILSTDGGNYTLNNQINLTGLPTLSGGQLTFALGSATGALLTNVALTGNTTLTVNNVTSITNAIVGGSNLALGASSTGTLYLTNGGNTFSGGATLAGGTLKIGAGTTVTSGAISSGPVGTGTLTLSGGTFQSDGGSYSLANQVSLNASTIITGGTISFDPQGTTSTVALAGNASLAVNNTTTIVGAVTGTNSLTLSAASTGTLYLPAKLPVSVLGSNTATGSTFSGGMTVAGGTLEIGASSTVGGFLGSNFLAAGPVGTGTLTLSGGTLESDGGNYTLNNAVNLSGNITMTGLSGGTLTFDPNILFVGVGLTGDTTLTVNNSTSITDQIFGGHSLSLAAANAGTLYLGNANNNYTGGTNVAGGTLSFNFSTFISGGNISSGPLGTGPLMLSGGTLLQNGGGSTLANAVNFNGSVTISGGPLTFDPTGLQTATAATLLGDATLTVNNTTAIKNAIGGSHSLTLAAGSTGTLYLANPANNFSGGVNLQGGTLELHGASTISGAGFRFISNGPVGTGTLTLSGGTIQSDSGGSAISNQVNLGGNVMFAGGSFGIDSLFAPTNGPGTIALTADSILTVNNTTGFTSLITGNHSLTLGGRQHGTLFIANVTGGETYSGGTNVFGGTLEIDAGSTVSGGVLTQGPVGTGPLSLGGGTFRTDGGSYTLANPLSLGGIVTLNAGTLVFDPAGLQTPSVASLAFNALLTVNNATTIKEQITGGHSLTLAASSTGTLYLTNAGSTYSGGTTLSGGTLEIGASSISTNGVVSSGPTGTGFLSLFGGTLRTDGGNYTLSRVGLNGSVTIAGGGVTIGPPSGGFVMFVGGNSTLTVNNTTTISEQISAGAFGLTLGSGSTGTLYLTNNSNSINGMTVAGGTLEIGASSFVSGGSLQTGPVGEGNLTLSAGTLASDGGNYTLSNPTSLSGNLVFTGGSLTFDPQGDSAAVFLDSDTMLTVNNLTTIKDVIANNFKLTLTAASTGTLYLTNPGSTYLGLIQAGGTVEIGASSNVNGGIIGGGPLGDGIVTISGGTLETDGGNYTLANRFNLSGNFTFAGGQLTLDAQRDGAIVTLQGNTAITVNNTTIIDEPIGGNAGLTVASSSTGILKLETANTFTGGVNLAGGTLFVGNDAALGTGTLTIRRQRSARGRRRAAHNLQSRFDRHRLSDHRRPVQHHVHQLDQWNRRRLDQERFRRPHALGWRIARGIACHQSRLVLDRWKPHCPRRRDELRQLLTRECLDLHS